MCEHNYPPCLIIVTRHQSRLWIMTPLFVPGLDMHAGEYEWFAWIVSMSYWERQCHLPHRFQYAPHITSSIRWTLCKGRPRITITTTYPDQDHNSVWKLGHPRFSHHNVHWHFKLKHNAAHAVLEIMHLTWSWYMQLLFSDQWQYLATFTQPQDTD